jgi:hypothetical protein
MPEDFHRVAFAPDVVLQMIDGEAVLLKLQDEAVFSLNQTGARVAALIAEGQPVEAVIDTLGREYGARPQDLERDVRLLVQTLLSRGLLIATGGQGT